MLKEVIDNAVDEFIMGEGKRVEIEREGETVSVRDFGRGIPLGKLVDCVSQINTGGKYNDDVFQFSVGLNGVGTKAVNALSSDFEVTSWREGRFRRPATSSAGACSKDKKGHGDPPANGTLRPLHARPRDLRRLRLERRVHRAPAALLRLPEQRASTLVYNGETLPQRRHGLADLLGDELGDEPPLYDVVHAAGRTASSSPSPTPTTTARPTSAS